MTHHEQIRGFIAHLKKNKRLDMFECHAEPLQELLDENEKQAAAIKVLRDALDAVMTYGGDMLPKLIQSKAQEALKQTEEL